MASNHCFSFSSVCAARGCARRGVCGSWVRGVCGTRRHRDSAGRAALHVCRGDRRLRDSTPSALGAARLFFITQSGHGSRVPGAGGSHLRIPTQPQSRGHGQGRAPASGHPGGFRFPSERGAGAGAGRRGAAGGPGGRRAPAGGCARRLAASLCGSTRKESARSAGDLGSIPGLEGPPEKGTATQSSILAWRIPWTVWSLPAESVGAFTSTSAPDIQGTNSS